MKKLKLLICGLLSWLLANVEAAGRTYVSEPIAANVVWELAGSPYVVTNDILVQAGAVLRIEAGVRVEFSRDVQITVEGLIKAEGILGAPIEFVGLEQGRWEGFVFKKSSGVWNKSGADTAANVFSHCIFKGRDYTPSCLMRCEDRSVQVFDCKIYDCRTAIQTERQGAAHLAHCKISRCYRPLHIRVTSQALVEHCRIEEFALMLVSGSLRFGHNRVAKSLSRGKHTGFVVWQIGAAMVDIYDNDFVRSSQAAFTLYKTARRSTVRLRGNRFARNFRHLSLSCEQVNRGKFLVQYNFFYKAEEDAIELFGDCSSKTDTFLLDSNHFYRMRIDTAANPQKIAYATPGGPNQNSQMCLICKGLLPASARRKYIAKADDKN